MKRHATIILILSCFFLNGYAQDVFTNLDNTQTATFKANLSKVSESINTLTCSFTQVQSMSLLADEVSSKGTMTYKSPDMLAWVYTAPTEQSFIFVMNTITVKSGKSRTMVDSGSSPMMQEMCKIIIAGLKGDTESLEKSFKITYSSDNKSFKIDMQPRNKAMARMFSTMTLLFDAESYLVSEIILSESTGDKSTIFISDVKQNINVDDSFQD